LNITHNLSWCQFCVIFGRPFVKPFALRYRTVVLSLLSVTLVYCGQTVGRIKMKLGMQVGLGPGHIVLDGNPANSPIKGHSLQFSAHIYCARPNGCMNQDATWYGGRPRPRRHCVRWRPSSPPLTIKTLGVTLDQNLTLNKHLSLLSHSTHFRQPFVKRFALCYRSVVCSVCPVLSYM